MTIDRYLATRCLSRAIRSAVIVAEGGDPDGDFGRTAFMTAIAGKRSGSPASPRMTKLSRLAYQESPSWRTKKEGSAEGRYAEPGTTNIHESGRYNVNTQREVALVIAIACCQ